MPIRFHRRHFLSLQGIERMRMLDSLCSNLTVLAASTARMLVVEVESRQEATIMHRSALKVCPGHTTSTG